MYNGQSASFPIVLAISASMETELISHVTSSPNIHMGSETPYLLVGLAFTNRQNKIASSGIQKLQHTAIRLDDVRGCRGVDVIVQSHSRIVLPLSPPTASRLRFREV